MKRLRLLLAMPWVASASVCRWVTAALIGVALLVAVICLAIGAALPASGYLVTGTNVLAFSVWFLWSGYIPANLQLARDAQVLRLPRIGRAADHSLLLFIVVGWVVPVLVCWAIGVPQPFATEILGVAAAAGMAYLMLPLYLGITLTVALAVLLTARGGDLPDAGWLALGIPLIVFDAWRWWRLRSARAVRVDSAHAAAVFYIYHLYKLRRASGGYTDANLSVIQRQLSNPGRVTVHGLGPARPVTALRFALGGLAMPKPASARLRDAGLLAIYLAIFVLLFVMPQALFPSWPHDAAFIRLHWLSPLLLYTGILTCILGVTLFAGRTLSVWRKPDAELALLALLPGLGTAGQQRGRLLRALLLPAAVFLIGATAAWCVVAAAIHTSAWAYIAIGICALGSFTLVAAITFETLGHRTVHVAAYLLSLGVAFLLALFLLQASLPSFEHTRQALHHPGVPPAWVVVAWMLFLLIAGSFACKGWLELRRRPHPFLAGAR
ncbi:MAG TPA: hypothetical protein VFL63_12170 [Rhodanobacteraceae bacterium]|jgi:hypothetical protein|nr:hypothetical protein [Rhodanobacteraceae bacterium]